jgi:hypothetical protein
MEAKLALSDQFKTLADEISEEKSKLHRAESDQFRPILETSDQ